MKYLLFIDYGKPYEEKANTKKEVFKILQKLEDLNEKEDFSYFDVEVLRKLEKGQKINPLSYRFINECSFKDVTNEIFKEFEKMKGGIK